MRHPHERLKLSRIIPPKDEGQGRVGVSVKMPKELLEGIDEVAEATSYSRSEIIIHFSRWALQEWRLEQAAADKKGKR